tara:strand:- start:59 stop:286 length:228 start_codon:yes stop_codon:yes gene_type:complete
VGNQDCNLPLKPAPLIPAPLSPPHCRVCPRFRPPRTFDAALALDDALLLLLPLPLRCVLLLLLQLRPWVWSRPAG